MNNAEEAWQRHLQDAMACCEPCGLACNTPEKKREFMERWNKNKEDTPNGIQWQAWGKEDYKTPGFSIDIRLIRSDDTLIPKKGAFRLPWLDPPTNWIPKE